MASPGSPHIILASHAGQTNESRFPVDWGANDPKQRGPVVATFTNVDQRNAIGSHGGSYTVYRALAVAAGQFPSDHRPDLGNTDPTDVIGPYPSWYEHNRIISMDPWGAGVGTFFKDELAKGVNIQPSVAVTKAHLQIAEIQEKVKNGEIEIDGEVVRNEHDVLCTKAAIEPVWYLPGLAERFGVSEGILRRTLFESTGGLYPELVTRPDIKVLLPPIGSATAYIFGNPRDLANPDVNLTCRVHDECNGSDVFGSDICTCRPYLTYGIENAIRSAQNGGVGLIVYYRKEGRALGEVTKFLVYNARKRQEGGDSAANYFHRTECVAGVQDARFQELMPDILHWFGIKRIHNLVSMSDMKYNAIAGSGIEVLQRTTLPEDLIPEDAKVEIEAKKAHGYFSEGGFMSGSELANVMGKNLDA